jgi:peroxiredoxin
MKFKKTFLFAILLLYLSASAQSRTDEQMAIDFSVDTLDGKIYSLEDFKGRNLIVVFWSTSCPICQKDLPKLNDLLKNLQTNVQVLAITAENETKVSKFLKSNPLNFIIGINGLDVILRYAKKNSRGEFILNYPYYVLINPQGEIVEKIEGEGKTERVVRKIEQLIENKTQKTNCSQLFDNFNSKLILKQSYQRAKHFPPRHCCKRLRMQEFHFLF